MEEERGKGGRDISDSRLTGCPSCAIFIIIIDRKERGFEVMDLCFAYIL